MTTSRGSPHPSALPAAAPLLTVALAAGLAVPSPAAAQQDLDVPYVPTPMDVVDQMLELAQPTAEDSLYDPGSGDGRIVVRAAEKFGTPGVGIELDSGRVARARTRAREAGVEDLVRFRHGDLFEADYRPATIVTMYLLSTVNLKLRPKLLRELRPGTRVVSHDFDMDAWQPDSVVTVDEHNSTVYYWVIPASIAGTWELNVPGRGRTTIEIRQKFQELRASVPASDGSASVREARIRGRDVTLVLDGLGGSGPVRLRGTVEDGRMRGEAPGGGTWSAERTAGAGQPIDRWSESGTPAGGRR